MSAAQELETPLTEQERFVMLHADFVLVRTSEHGHLVVIELTRDRRVLATRRDQAFELAEALLLAGEPT